MTPQCADVNGSPFTTGQLADGDDGVFRPGGIELTARAVALANLKPGATILDLGCGAGHTVRYLRSLGFHAKGLDLRAQIDDGGATSWLVAGRAEELPLPDDSMDAVLAECSLSLVEDQKRALAECARVIKDRGKLIVSDLYARQPEMIGHVRSLAGSCVSGMMVRTELETQLVANGFDVDAWEDHSRALRECAARYILEHGSCDSLWGCTPDATASNIDSAMRAVRAGYFLLVATRRKRGATERRTNS
jgi:arsenite methyltransferase